MSVLFGSQNSPRIPPAVDAGLRSVQSRLRREFDGADVLFLEGSAKEGWADARQKLSAVALKIRGSKSGEKLSELLAGGDIVPDGSRGDAGRLLFDGALDTGRRLAVVSIDRNEAPDEASRKAAAYAALFPALVRNERHGVPRFEEKTKSLMFGGLAAASTGAAPIALGRWSAKRSSDFIPIVGAEDLIDDTPQHGYAMSGGFMEREMGDLFRGRDQAAPNSSLMELAGRASHGYDQFVRGHEATFQRAVPAWVDGLRHGEDPKSLAAMAHQAGVPGQIVNGLSQATSAVMGPLPGRSLRVGLSQDQSPTHPVAYNPFLVALTQEAAHWEAFKHRFSRSLDQVAKSGNVEPLRLLAEEQARNVGEGAWFGRAPQTVRRAADAFERMGGGQLGIAAALKAFSGGKDLDTAQASSASSFLSRAMGSSRRATQTAEREARDANREDPRFKTPVRENDLVL